MFYICHSRSYDVSAVLQAIFLIIAFDLAIIQINRTAPADLFHYRPLFVLFYFSLLIHSSMETRKRIIDKQCRLRSKPHNVVSDQGLQCLLTRFSIKYRIKETK